MAERRMPRGLLDPESEAIAEAYAAIPSVRRQTRGLLSLDPQEDQSMTQAALEMALSLFPGVGQAMALRDIERARRANDPAAAAMAATEFVPFGRMLGGMRRGGPIMSELDVYHGTPHRYAPTEANPLGEFDASKIGTGEGAQAYGHGIYLAESPGVAESYKQMSPQMLPVGKYEPHEEMAYYAGRMVRQLGSPEKVLARLEGKGGKAQEIVDAIKDGSYKPFYDKVQQSSLYKADLPDEMIDRMLDWDKPLSEQPWVMKRITPLLEDSGISKDLIPKLTGKDVMSTDGPMAAWFGVHRTQKMYAEGLRQEGIPGIKYLDAGSRGQGGSGTRNFVVFPGEEKKVKILERK